MTTTAKPSPLLGRFLVLCAVIFMSLPSSLRSEEALQEQSDLDATEPGPLEAAKQDKPWLITPTLSADPKLGANVGALIAYLKRLDAESTPSMAGLSISYSDTDSSTAAAFSQLYWSADTRRLSLLAATAEINNEYDDFWAPVRPSRLKTTCIVMASGTSTNSEREGGLVVFKASAQTTPSVPMDC